MKVIVNGEIHTMEEVVSISDLLAHFSVRSEKGVAVALNLKVVPKTQFHSTIVTDGDRVDIIHATAGG